ncbi:hypothetical protein T06_10008 [Trichinella sp. T6]|nr:hypothetical protein T06_10008 [Trichinella sp. T6]
MQSHVAHPSKSPSVGVHDLFSSIARLRVPPAISFGCIFGVFGCTIIVNLLHFLGTLLSLTSMMSPILGSCRHINNVPHRHSLHHSETMDCCEKIHIDEGLAIRSPQSILASGVLTNLVPFRISAFRVLIRSKVGETGSLPESDESAPGRAG